MVRKKSTSALLLIGSANDCPDLVYTSGFRAPDPAVVLRTPRHQYLVVPELEFGRAQKLGQQQEVLTPAMLGLHGKGARDPGSWALKILRRAGLKHATVPRDFPLHVAEKLRRRGLRITAARGATLPQRMCKTREEIRNIREAQQAAVIAMRMAAGLLAAADVSRGRRLMIEHHSLTSEKVRRKIQEALLGHDCFCEDVIVAVGAQGADPHECGSGPIRAGDSVVIDIFPRHLRHGYFGDITRTFVKGVASPELRSMYSAVKAAQAVALAAVRPRVQCATVHRAAADEFRRRGFAVGRPDGERAAFIHGTGHGLGLAVHEAPSVGLNSTQLRTGHVITIEPGLYAPGFGGVRIEDTVQVTPSGWRYLVPCEKRLEIH